MWPPKRMVSPLVSRTGWFTGGLALVPDRNRNLACRNLAHQLEQVPLVFLRLLDAELVHVLHRLVVFLAEAHGALGRLEAHALHRCDQLLGVGTARLLD